jgi:drug/metabolite transporter (DMT)-like permease
MNRSVKNEVFLLGACVVALVVAAFTHLPYFFYVLLRVLICAASAYLSTKRYQERRTPWVWIFGAIALLFNPVFPVRMTRPDWQVINVLTASFFTAWSVYSTIQTVSIGSPRSPQK